MISHGKVEITVNEDIVMQYGPGESFGELALLHNTRRSASVEALTNVTLWGLDRESFRKALETLNDANLEDNVEFINTLKIFESFEPS